MLKDIKSAKTTMKAVISSFCAKRHKNVVITGKIENYR